MSVLSVHPVEYLRLHLHLGHGQSRPRVQSSVQSLGLQIGAMADKVAMIAVVLLTVSLVTFAFMKLGESGTVMASYCNSCGQYSAPFVAPW